MTDINSLPVEILVKIFMKTDGITLARCRSVCKKWKEIIDTWDNMWKKMCFKEYRYPTKIAKHKCGSECKWYNMYRNFHMWSKGANFELKMRKFYKFSLHDDNHALGISYGILPLRDTRKIVFYDMNTLKYIPLVFPDKNVSKIINNRFATVILLKTGIFVHRPVKDPSHMSEAFFEAENFTLHSEELFFYNKRDIYKCNLLFADLKSVLIHRLGYDIRAMQYSNNKIHIFTTCGLVLNIFRGKSVLVRSFYRPPNEPQDMKFLCVVDYRNYVFYSENIFKCITIKYQTMSRSFPPITALFFYVDFILIGTKTGKILLFRPSNQEDQENPVFENVAQLPKGKFAVQLDVCERNSGPVIVAATFYEIMILEINFFPKDKETKPRFQKRRPQIYKSLLRIRDKLKIGLPQINSIT